MLRPASPRIAVRDPRPSLRRPGHPARIRSATIALVAAVLFAPGGTLAGCGVPPELRDLPDDPTRSTPSSTPTGVVSAPASAPAVPPTRPRRGDPTGFGAMIAVDCAGQPTGNQVVSLLRRVTGLLPTGVRVTVTIGPLCAGTWQYTVVTVPGREPLQVVSNGPATDLNLVTRGTDVCNIPVRTIAPPAIRLIACDGVLPPTGLPVGYG